MNDTYKGEKIESRFSPLLFRILLVVLIAGKLLLIGKGAFFFPDEKRYQSSIKAANLLSNGHVREFFGSIASTDGRPGDALIRLFPAIGQTVVSSVWGLNYMHPASSVIPVLFNFLAIAISAWVFFKICLLLLKDEISALVAGIAYTCLVNTNIYLRHILPYDAALCLMLYTIYLAIKAKQQDKLTCTFFGWMGFLSAFTLIVYPGYYMAPFFVLTVIIDWLHPFRFLGKYWVHILLYGIGGAGLIVAVELFARVAGYSYLLTSYSLAHTVTQGSFEEGFSFLFKYLFTVEGALGYTLVGLAACFIIKTLLRLLIYKSRYSEGLSELNRLLITATAIFLVHASFSYFGHKVVFYGRLLHPFIPFVVLAAVSFIESITNNYIKNIALNILSVIAVVSFAMFFYSYSAVQYPYDILNSLRVDVHGKEFSGYVNELKTDTALYYNKMRIFKTNHSVPTFNNVTLLNFAYLYPVKPSGLISIPAHFGQRLIYDAPHALNFRAYTFEGYGIEERNMLHKLNLREQVWAGNE